MMTSSLFGNLNGPLSPDVRGFMQMYVNVQVFGFPVQIELINRGRSLLRNSKYFLIKTCKQGGCFLFYKDIINPKYIETISSHCAFTPNDLKRKKL